jgi:hypothetical protein
MSSMSRRSEHHIRCGFGLAVPESAGGFKEKAHDLRQLPPKGPGPRIDPRCSVERRRLHRLFNQPACCETDQLQPLEKEATEGGASLKAYLTEAGRIKAVIRYIGTGVQERVAMARLNPQSVGSDAATSDRWLCSSGGEGGFQTSQSELHATRTCGVAEGAIFLSSNFNILGKTTVF